MALLFMDGFDHLSSTDLTKKWNSASSSISSPGRSGSGQFASNGQLAKGLPSSYATLVVGIAVKWSTLPNGTQFIRFYDGLFGGGGTMQICVRQNLDGTVSVVNNSNVVLATSSSFGMQTGVWNYFEVKVTFAGSSTGTINVKCNGASVISSNAMTTISTANASASCVYFSAEAMDDVYVCDTSGTLNKDFLGDVTIKTVFPNADGTYTQFTPSTGTAHWSLVDETTNNGDTDYVSSATVGNRDTYNFTDLSSVNVLAAQLHTIVKKEAAGDTVQVNTVCKSGATVTTGTKVAPGTSYQLLSSSILETDPNTGSAWTLTNLNAAEFGVEVAS